MSSTSPARSPRSWPAWVLRAAVYGALGYLAYVVFARYVFEIPNNDHRYHVNFARNAARGGKYPPHFLYQGLLNLFTGFSGGRDEVATAAVWLLTIFVALKLALTEAFYGCLTRRAGHGARLGAALAVPLVFFFLSPIANWWQWPRIYLGQFSPTVWHNPTVVMVMPFAVGVFALLFRGRTGGVLAPIAGSSLLALSLLMKPNFGLVFLPVLALAAARRWVGVRELAIYAVPGAAALAWLFVRGTDFQEGLIQFQPLAVWSRFCPQPLGSLLVSFAFPLAVLALYGRRVHHGKLYVFTWISMVVALGYYLLFAEAGDRMLHGNFVWGTVPALYLLFLVSFAEWRIAAAEEERVTVSSLVCGLVLLAHVATGIFFFYRSWQGYSSQA